MGFNVLSLYSALGAELFEGVKKLRIPRVDWQSVKSVANRVEAPVRGQWTKIVSTERLHSVLERAVVAMEGAVEDGGAMVTIAELKLIAHHIGEVTLLAVCLLMVAFLWCLIVSWSGLILLQTRLYLLLSSLLDRAYRSDGLGPQLPSDVGATRGEQRKGAGALQQLLGRIHDAQDRREQAAHAKDQSKDAASAEYADDSKSLRANEEDVQSTTAASGTKETSLPESTSDIHLRSSENPDGPAPIAATRFRGVAPHHMSAEERQQQVRMLSMAYSDFKGPHTSDMAQSAEAAQTPQPVVLGSRASGEQRPILCQCVPRDTDNVHGTKHTEHASARPAGTATHLCETCNLKNRAGLSGADHTISRLMKSSNISQPTKQLLPTCPRCGTRHPSSNRCRIALSAQPEASTAQRAQPHAASNQARAARSGQGMDGVPIGANKCTRCGNEAPGHFKRHCPTTDSPDFDDWTGAGPPESGYSCAGCGRKGSLAPLNPVSVARSMLLLIQNRRSLVSFLSRSCDWDGQKVEARPTCAKGYPAPRRRRRTEHRPDPPPLGMTAHTDTGTLLTASPADPAKRSPFSGDSPPFRNENLLAPWELVAEEEDEDEEE
ncbi:hypothetical protein LTR66_014227 [Elasticomyces elasticus]|nr:hypothetical protein LTR66_014227 [Elasticomyces elasticus]